MLKKVHRLRRSQDIARVLKTGQRAQPGGYVTIYKIPSPAPTSRYTCIVGKKVSPSSVARHKIQRWLREVGRELLNRQTIPMDIVVVAHPKITEVESLADLKKTLLK